MTSEVRIMVPFAIFLKIFIFSYFYVIFSGYLLTPNHVLSASGLLRKTKGACTWHAHHLVNLNFAGEFYISYYRFIGEIDIPEEFISC